MSQAIAALVEKVGGSLLTKEGLKQVGAQIVKNKINSKLAPYGVQGIGAPGGPDAGIKYAWQTNQPPSETNPQEYTEQQRIQAVLDGRIPPTESDLRLIDLFMRQRSGVAGQRSPSRQNPSFFNSAQQSLMR